VTWTPPIVDMAAITARSGLDYLRGLIETGQTLPIGQTLDFHPVRFEFGEAVFEGTPAEFHYNPIGAVHGGFAATLLDSALGCAVHSTLPPGLAYTTVELKINYVRPLQMRTGPVTCTGRIIHAGSRIATAEARLTDAGGKLYAHGTTTCLIFRPEDRGRDDTEGGRTGGQAG
jgi:uncharacterized protein (TIGR00369 family)